MPLEAHLVDLAVELADVAEARVAQHGDDLAPLGQGQGGADGGDAVDSGAAAGEDAVVLDEPAGHAAGLVVRDGHGVVDEVEAGLERGRDAVHADALDDAVDPRAAGPLLLGPAPAGEGAPGPVPAPDAPLPRAPVPHLRHHLGPRGGAGGG